MQSNVCLYYCVVLCVDLVLQIKLPVVVDERHIGFFLYLQQTHCVAA